MASKIATAIIRNHIALGGDREGSRKAQGVSQTSGKLDGFVQWKWRKPKLVRIAATRVVSVAGGGTWGRGGRWDQGGEDVWPPVEQFG